MKTTRIKFKKQLLLFLLSGLLSGSCSYEAKLKLPEIKKRDLIVGGSGLFIGVFLFYVSLKLNKSLKEDMEKRLSNCQVDTVNMWYQLDKKQKKKCLKILEYNPEKLKKELLEKEKIELDPLEIAYVIKNSSHLLNLNDVHD